MSITEVGSLGGGTTVVTRDHSSDTRPSYLLYFVLWVHDNHEVDALKEHQLKQTQSGNSKLKQMQSGSSSWGGRNWGVVQHRTRLLGHQSRGLLQARADVVKEVRPQKHTYVCSEERSVVRCAVLTRMKWELLQLLHHEELQVLDCSRRYTKGCLKSVDWTTGLEQRARSGSK